MAYDHSIREAADELGITVQAVHKRIAAGTLEAQKVNGRWMVDGDSLLDAKGKAVKRGRPRKGDAYTLMNGNYVVLDFSYDELHREFTPREVYDSMRAPIGAVTRAGRGSAAGLKRWWDHRSIPGNRVDLDAKLAELGLADPALIPFRNLGLSLSDQYWVRSVGMDMDWGELNYFQNGFGTDGQKWDEWLSDVGLSSPDNTSEGVLPKKWICEGETRTLIKGHVPWTDQQAYNEVVATALHKRLLEPGEFVSYEVRRLDRLGVVSACPCFVRPDEEYVPASLIVEAGGARKGEGPYDALVRCAVNLGIPRSEVVRRLAKMIVCDSLIANSDRHLRNFGFIRNIDTLRWHFAPLFDSGNSLWYDKDESAVARGDFSFIARPFVAAPNRQLMLTADSQWFDLGLLDGFADEAAGILEEGDLSGWRLDYLRDGIEKRIDALRVIWG